MTKTRKKYMKNKKRGKRKTKNTGGGRKGKTLSEKKSPKIISKSIKSLPTKLDSLELLETLSHSFSPSVNKELSELLSESPNTSIYNCDNEGDIQIEDGDDDFECVQ